MDHRIQTGNRSQCGFTLLELLIVLLVIALLASVASPVVTGSLIRAKEAALRENLYVMRKAIDDYYADKGKYPESLEALVTDKYVRKIPPEPILEVGDGWRVRWEEGVTDDPGIIDIYSGSDEQGTDGTRYSDW